MKIAVKKHQLLDEYELKQFRFPKSKKKRIRKKWEKRSENFKLVYGKNLTVIMNNETKEVFMSSAAYNKYSKEILLRRMGDLESQFTNEYFKKPPPIEQIEIIPFRYHYDVNDDISKQRFFTDNLQSYLSKNLEKMGIKYWLFCDSWNRFEMTSITKKRIKNTKTIEYYVNFGQKLLIGITIENYEYQKKPYIKYV